MPVLGLSSTARVIGGLLDTVDPDDSDPQRAWIRDALGARATILDRVRALTGGPTGYSAQVIHGALGLVQPFKIKQYSCPDLPSQTA